MFGEKKVYPHSTLGLPRSLDFQGNNSMTIPFNF